MSHLITNELDDYLRRCYRFPGARTKFATLKGAFLSTLTPRQQRKWPRKRIIEELSRQFVLGHDSTNTLIIGELSLVAPPKFENVGGKLKLTA